MNIIIFYLILIAILSPWVVATIYAMYEVRKLKKKLENFIEEFKEDEE